MTSVLLALALTAGDGASHVAFDTGATPTVQVSNVAGPITVEAIPGTRTEVDAEWLSGSEAEQKKWTVDLRGKAGEVVARVCCGPCDVQDRDRNCSGDAKLAFTLRVPAGSRVTANQVSGTVSVKGVVGDLEVHSVSGKVKVEGTEGALDLRSVSGDVEARAAKASSARLETVSADVVLVLPASTGADVSFTTVSGALNGQKPGIGHLESRVRGGGVKVQAQSVSGNVEVK
ncbi:MAG: DUF4097 family beta strand repeat protein [Deltaproteobacteria bacterium]|nr:DUF4097 family beta strand repeat protein [Deltaproteobacteria bacterium]